MNGSKSNSKNCSNLSLHGHRNVSRPPSICIPPWAGGTAPHPGGRGGRSSVETRVSLCQYQIPPPHPFAVPHYIDTSWSLPDCTSSTSVPVVGLASMAFTKPHPLDGDLQLSSRRGWARLGEQFRPRVRSQLRTFFIFGEKCEKPLPGSSARSSTPAGK